MSELVDELNKLSLGEGALPKVKPEEEKEEEELCPICLKGGGFLFSAPCAGKHKFHLGCINRWATVRKNRLNCPVCRDNIEPETQPHASCSNCEKECPLDYFCDSCEKVVCSECLIKKNVPNSRLDFCPSCVKFFHALYRARKSDIDSVISDSTFPSCCLCGSVVCYHCQVNNGEDDYCVSCVNQINGIYLKQIDGVEVALSFRKSP